MKYPWKEGVYEERKLRDKILLSLLVFVLQIHSSFASASPHYIYIETAVQRSPHSPDEVKRPNHIVAAYLHVDSLWHLFVLLLHCWRDGCGRRRHRHKEYAAGWWWWYKEETLEEEWIHECQNQRQLISYAEKKWKAKEKNPCGFLVFL